MFFILPANNKITKPLWNFSTSICGNNFTHTEPWIFWNFWSTFERFQLWLYFAVRSTSQPLFRHNWFWGGKKTKKLFFFSCDWHSFSCQSTAQCTNNFLGMSLKATKADWSCFCATWITKGKTKRLSRTRN